METSPVNCYHKKRSGLTLIEVLIALAIVGIALMAVIRATTQHIRSTAYLQNKTIAMWVGQQAMNEAIADLIKLSSSEKLQQTTTMFDQEWNWIVSQEETPNKSINKVIVQVFKGAHTDDDEASPILTLESYHEKK